MGTLLCMRKLSQHIKSSFADLLDPDVGGHDLVLEVDVDQLGELEPQLDGQLLRVVGHGPDEAVVVAQQVVVQPLGVGVAPHQA